MGNLTVTVSVGDQKHVFKNVPEGAVAEIAIERHLPERSPLHPEALNMADLKVGMNVRRHNARYGSCTRDVGLINGEPFRRGTKYHEPWDTQGDVLMVPVVTTNHAGRLVHEDWFLADMGVTPYEGKTGTRGGTSRITLWPSARFSGVARFHRRHA